MNELHLFAGAGGGILGGQLLGHRTVCAVEWEPYAQAVLVARQNDGTFPPFPIWGDVQTFDGKPWRGIVDVVCGGFPCQDISVAGKGAGITGERSGMWSHMARIIGEVRPRFAFVENSPALITRGLGVVLSDLAALGYDTRWGVLGAADVGGQHQRDRIWIIANRDKGTLLPLGQCETDNPKWRVSAEWRTDWIDFLVENDREPYPAWRNRGQGVSARPIMRRKSDGMAYWSNRINAVGNGQVPRVAATAWRMLGGP